MVESIDVKCPYGVELTDLSVSDVPWSEYRCKKIDMEGNLECFKCPDKGFFWHNTYAPGRRRSTIKLSEIAQFHKNRPFM